jgi:hypothetical protein
MECRKNGNSRRLDAGFLMLDTGFRLPDAGHWTGAGDSLERTTCHGSARHAAQAPALRVDDPAFPSARANMVQGMSIYEAGELGFHEIRSALRSLPITVLRSSSPMREAAVAPRSPMRIGFG